MFGAGIVIFLWAVMSIVPMPNSWDDLKKHFRSSVLFCKLLFQVYTYKIIKNSSKIFVITIQSIMCHKLYCFFPSIKLLTPSPLPLQPNICITLICSSTFQNGWGKSSNLNKLFFRSLILWQVSKKNCSLEPNLPPSPTNRKFIQRLC